MTTLQDSMAKVTDYSGPLQWLDAHSDSPCKNDDFFREGLFLPVENKAGSTQ